MFSPQFTLVVSGKIVYLSLVLAPVHCSLCGRNISVFSGCIRHMGSQIGHYHRAVWCCMVWYSTACYGLLWMGCHLWVYPRSCIGKWGPLYTDRALYRVYCTIPIIHCAHTGGNGWDAGLILPIPILGCDMVCRALGNVDLHCCYPIN